MKKNLLLLLLSSFVFSLCSCVNNVASNDEKESKSEWKAEKAIYKTNIYQIYKTDGNTYSGLVFLGIAEAIAKDGKKAYNIYSNFVNNYSNAYSLSSLKYDEDEIPVIIEFLDECQSFNPDEKEDVVQQLRYTGKDGYVFAYNKGEGITVIDDNNNRYNWDMSISEIRNLFAGAKDRIESLKKADKK